MFPKKQELLEETMEQSLNYSGCMYESRFGEVIFSMKSMKSRYGIIKGLVLMAIILMGVGGFCYGYQELNAAPMTKSNLIRLHVIANSDSVYDQKVKLLVRDEVINQMAPYLKEANTAKEARSIALQQLPEIKKAADNFLASLGQQYQASVELGNYNFPAKAYGDFVLPSGNYEALRVVLGEGEGRNWWCVLYPPLCFIDISSTIAVNVRDLPENWERVEQVSGEPMQVVVRFKLWDEVQNFLDKRILAKGN
jgi:stage II sporulation protein R